MGSNTIQVQQRLYVSRRFIQEWFEPCLRGRHVARVLVTYDLDDMESSMPPRQYCVCEDGTRKCYIRAGVDAISPMTLPEDLCRDASDAAKGKVKGLYHYGWRRHADGVLVALLSTRHRLEVAVGDALSRPSRFKWHDDAKPMAATRARDYTPPREPVAHSACRGDDSVLRMLTDVLLSLEAPTAAAVK